MTPSYPIRPQNPLSSGDDSRTLSEKEAASGSGLLATIERGGQKVHIDLNRGIDLSIPMSFTDDDPNLYAISPASKTTFQIDGMVGDTRMGGSCNVDVISLTPHCHGTHTECVGHVTHERVSIRQIAPLGLLPCAVVSVTPESLLDAGETSRPSLSSGDVGITKQVLRRQLKNIQDEWLEAVVIRTLPNKIDKRRQAYFENGAPFFSIEAISYLMERGVRHLLVDLPSLDRLHDKGEMAAHRTWWNIEKGLHHVPDGPHLLRTITELIFVPDEVEDGCGLVSIQIPPFESDAAPSRPIYYAAHTIS